MADKSVIFNKKTVTTVSADIDTDINAEVHSRVEKAINECIQGASKDFLRNISVDFAVKVQ